MATLKQHNKPRKTVSTKVIKIKTLQTGGEKPATDK
jgi:hypothetical protein